MSQSLAGQVAIVTGAGRGFGRAIAERLAAEGAAVTVTARTVEQIESTVREIESAGGQALAIAGDMTEESDVRRTVESTRRRFGPATLLINNAGVPDPFGPISEVDTGAWWAAQEVHVLAPLNAMRAVLPDMVQRRTGRIINVSAFGGQVVAPYMSAYCVGKATQIRLTEYVAEEMREHGISAFAIDPGFVFTQLAADTLGSADAQRWLPGMMERLEQRRDDPEAKRDLERCAQRCVDLASGRYDSLSGRFFRPEDDLEELLDMQN